jgi:hypothetical protein
MESKRYVVREQTTKEILISPEIFQDITSRFPKTEQYSIIQKTHLSAIKIDGCLITFQKSSSNLELLPPPYITISSESEESINSLAKKLSLPDSG